MATDKMYGTYHTSQTITVNGMRIAPNRHFRFERIVSAQDQKTGGTVNYLVFRFISGPNHKDPHEGITFQVQEDSEEERGMEESRFLQMY